MFNKDIEDEFHYGLNDISKHKETLEDGTEYKFDCFSLLLIGIEVFLGITSWLFFLFRR